MPVTNSKKGKIMTKQEALNEYIGLLEAYKDKVLSAATVNEIRDADMWRIGAMVDLIDKMSDSLPDSAHARLFVKAITMAFNRGYTCGLDGPLRKDATNGAKAWPEMLEYTILDAKELMGMTDEVD